MSSKRERIPVTVDLMQLDEVLHKADMYDEAESAGHFDFHARIVSRLLWLFLGLAVGLFLAHPAHAQAAATVFGEGSNEIHIEGGTGFLVYYWGLDQPDNYGDYRGDTFGETDIPWYGWTADGSDDHIYTVPGTVWFLEHAENECNTGATYQQCIDFANAEVIGCYYTDGETWTDITSTDCVYTPPETPVDIPSYQDWIFTQLIIIFLLCMGILPFYITAFKNKAI